MSIPDGEAVFTVLARVASEAVALAGASVCAVWIADEGARTLRVGAVGGDADSMALTVLAFGQGGVGWIAATRAPIEVNDVFADLRFVVASPVKTHSLPQTSSRITRANTRCCQL